jgi:signal peptidase
VLVGLHDVHPLLAIGATNGVLAFSILALVFGLFGLRSRRLRDTDRDVPLWTRLKRAVR